MSPKYEVFISGEMIDLVIPSEVAITEDGWHEWLNESQVNKYTGYGKIPNTSKKQKIFLEKLLEPDSNRFALLVVPKNETNAIGIVSLSSIDFEKRSAETALILSAKNRKNEFFYQGFEAKARITEHAFAVMGLERITGGQVVNLKKWQQVQLLFGFKPEGIMRKSYRRGRSSYDSVISACLVEDYEYILQHRKSYWPGKKELFYMMKNLPKENIVDSFSLAIDEFYKDFVKRNSLSMYLGK